jgi:beta-glucosidase
VFDVAPSDEPPGYRVIPITASHPKLGVSWRVLDLYDPEVVSWAPRHVRSLRGANTPSITESGCAASDVVADDGAAHESDRVLFPRASLTRPQRAAWEGAPVDGSCRWGVQDDFEWIAGRGDRFELFRVEVDALQRRSELSAAWFREADPRSAGG